MENYKVNGKYYEITLSTGKVVKCEREWAEKVNEIVRYRP